MTTGDEQGGTRGHTATTAADALAPRPRWRGRVARLLSGVLVLALTGGVVALAVTTSTPEAGAVPASIVEVEPSATTLVCPGPLQLPDDTTSGGSEFDRVPVDPVEAVTAFDTELSAVASLTPLGEQATALKGGAGTVPAPVAPVILRAEPVDGEPARVAGASSSLVTAGDLRGLSAGACARPSSDVWLVGGSTTIESTADLVVVNPGATAAEVTVEVWGPAGAVDLANSAGFLVAPGGQRVLVLPGVAAEQRRIAVHVSAAGGQVSAYLQDSLLDGFTPRGTDVVTAGVGPSTSQIVPGIVVPDTGVDATDAASLRLLAPGDESATVSVRLLGPGGDVALSGAEAVDLTPGEVTDVSLGGVAAGSYTAVVESSEPVVAAAMIARAGEAGELDAQPRLERAWSASTAGGSGLAAVPSHAQGVLALSAVPTGDEQNAEGTTPSPRPTPTASPTASATPSATPSPEPTHGQRPDPEATQEPIGPTLTVTVRVYGADGMLGEEDVEVPIGTTVPYDLADLGTGVVGVEVLADEDGPARLAWGLVASVTNPDGALVSVVAPLTDAAAVTQAEVREARRLGLG